MKEIGLRKGQRLSDKPANALSQSVIPALNVISFSRFFSNSSIIRKRLFISLPMIAEAFAFPINGRYSAPQLFGAFGSAVTYIICNYLPCSAAQGNPNPALVVPGVDVWPQFVKLQYIIRSRFFKSFFDGRQAIGQSLQPGSKRCPRHTKGALNPTHTRSLLIDFQNFNFSLKRVCLNRFKCCSSLAAFAEILLRTLIVLSVLHDVLTSALSTAMQFGCFDYVFVSDLLIGLL